MAENGTEAKFTFTGRVVKDPLVRSDHARLYVKVDQRSDSSDEILGEIFKVNLTGVSLLFLKNDGIQQGSFVKVTGEIRQNMINVENKDGSIGYFDSPVFHASTIESLKQGESK